MSDRLSSILNMVRWIADGHAMLLNAKDARVLTAHIDAQAAEIERLRRERSTLKKAVQLLDQVTDYAEELEREADPEHFREYGRSHLLRHAHQAHLEASELLEKEGGSEE